MINFDNIENSLRQEIADGNGDGNCDLTNTALLELITRIRQAEKDAARYKEIIGDCRGVFIIANDSEMVSAIDEAMQCK